MLFQGSSVVDLTPTGLAMPADLASLPADLIITAHPQRCLLLMPLARWSDVCAQLLMASTLNPASGAVRRLLMGSAHQVQRDATGRVPIPKELRQFARLSTARVVMAGIGHHFEIWSETQWAQQLEQAVNTDLAGVLL